MENDDLKYKVTRFARDKKYKKKKKLPKNVKEADHKLDASVGDQRWTL